MQRVVEHETPGKINTRERTSANANVRKRCVQLFLVKSARFGRAGRSTWPPRACPGVHQCPLPFRACNQKSNSLFPNGGGKKKDEGKSDPGCSRIAFRSTRDRIRHDLGRFNDSSYASKSEHIHTRRALPVYFVAVITLHCKGPATTKTSRGTERGHITFFTRKQSARARNTRRTSSATTRGPAVNRSVDSMLEPGSARLVSSLAAAPSSTLNGRLEFKL
jgi:hypothetical protein